MSMTRTMKMMRGKACVRRRRACVGVTRQRGHVHRGSTSKMWKKEDGGGGERNVRVNVGWDPEGILGPPKAGHIERRLFEKQLQKDKALKKKLEEETQKMREELLAKRAEREEKGLPKPGEHAAIVEYLMETETEEMRFEVARIKNCLDDAWFAYVEDEARAAKFDATATARADTAPELEALMLVVRAELEALEAAAARLSSPVDKLRALFQSKDKKQHILDMAGRNEIDAAFIDLMLENISAAEHAGNEQAADFMRKLADLCKRYETNVKKKEEVDVEAKVITADVL